MTRNRTLRGLLSSLAIAAILIAASATAAIAAPALRVTTSQPDFVTAGRLMVMYVSAVNSGSDPLSGDLTVRYTFPAGVVPADPEVFSSNVNLTCQTAGQVTECVGDATGIQPGVQIRLKTSAIVDPSASGTSPGSVEVSGAGTSDPFRKDFSFTVGPSGPFAIGAFGVTLGNGAVYPATRGGTDPTEVLTKFHLVAEARSNFDIPNPNTSSASPTESLRDTIVHVPVGFVGNPTATPIRCSPSQLTTPFRDTVIPQCPLESQIGIVQLNAQDIVPLYNVVPPEGSPAEFGFNFNSIIVTLLARVRPSDHGIDIVTQKAPSSIPIPDFEVTLWGSLSDRSHDPSRGFCLQGGFGYNGGDCALRIRGRVPFLRTPTSCPGTPLRWVIDMNTHQHPDVFVHNQSETPAMEGCGSNPFDPGFAFRMSTLAPHAPSGVDATLSMSQDWDVDGLAPGDVRSVSVKLPEGLTINPSSADGLAACTDAQLGLDQEGPSTCPDAAKLGTVELHSPLLDHPVGGTIFLRTQASDLPQTGRLFRIAVELRSDLDGIAIKLPGAIIADPTENDPRNGQLTTVFDDLPQLPFESMTLSFKQGPRAPLASPSRCGTHTTSADVVSWGNAVRHIETSFTTTGCKPPSFEPTLRAGVENPVAGSSSPFHVSLNRTDDDSEFSGLTLNTPRGLLARVKDATQCSNADATTGNCPAGSLIGHAKVAAGVGVSPLWVTNGRVFLTTSYRRAPYGLAVVVDAVAGPFNLGSVVVRQAIHVDPRTAELSVVSDPFPTSVKGVPLHVRTVRVSVDKARFMVAPTNCSTTKVSGTATATDGLTAPLASRFKVGGCSRLKFAPRLRFSVGGVGHNTLGRSTPLRTVLTQPRGLSSNLRSVRVSLKSPPLSALLDVVNNACTLSEYQADRCRKAEAGSAEAWTPLLKEPLRGGVFFVRHPGRPLPDLMVALRGDIDIDLVGVVTTPGGKSLTTNFNAIPDAPVSRFALNLVAGSHGPLGVSGNLCSKRRPPTADVTMIGQNGDRIVRHQQLHVNGCGGSKHRR